MTAKNTFKERLLSLILCFSMALSVLLPMNAVTTQAATKVNILEIGNSLTYSSKHGNSTISKLKALGEKSGYNFNIKYIAYGGEKLATYADSNKSRGKECEKLINSQKWDIVVLQEETDRAIKDPSLFKNAAIKLAKKIRAKSPNARIILNCTWAYDKKMYGYSHSEQQKKMNSNYKNVANAIKADIVYSGNAFDNYRKVKGALPLYRSDKNHASAAGCYLNACCLYTAFTRKTPYKVNYFGDWGKAKCLVMQQTAEKANSHLFEINMRVVPNKPPVKEQQQNTDKSTSVGDLKQSVNMSIRDGGSQ